MAGPMNAGLCSHRPISSALTSRRFLPVLSSFTHGVFAMRSFTVLTTVVVGLGAVVTLAAQGGAPPAGPRAGTAFDLQGFLDDHIKAGSQRIVIPPGRYRITPQHGRHLSFKGLSDLEIIAEGVEMICTQTSQAMVFEDCRQVHLRGLTIDYDPLPYTEGRITAMAPDKSWVEFDVIEGYPETKIEERIEIFDPATKELRRETAGWEKEIITLGNHRYRAVKPKAYRYREHWDTEQVGDILVTSHQSPARAGGHAIVAMRCKNLKLEDVTLYAASSFGFLEHSCDASTYLRCKIDRRPPTDDPVKRGFPRMRSLNADAFHSVEAAQGPAILECTAKFQGDDCVNIHGSYHLVTGCQGNRLRVAAVNRMNIEPGDVVEFLPYEGARPTDAVATQIEPDAPITDQEKAFVRKLSMLDRHRTRLLDGEAHFFQVTLDRAVSLTMGSAVCSGKRVGNGFVVKGCDFGYNRSRAILIKASRGEVSDNRITNGWMAAVLVSPEFWWLESASSSDVVIRGNQITGCRRPAIEVVAPGGNGKSLPSGAHRNISISNNTIAHSPWPNIRVTSTQGLIIRDNRLTPADPHDFMPSLTVPWKWGNTQPDVMLVEQSDRVE